MVWVSGCVLLISPACSLKEEVIYGEIGGFRFLFLIYVFGFVGDLNRDIGNFSLCLEYIVKGRILMNWVPLNFAVWVICCVYFYLFGLLLEGGNLLEKWVVLGFSFRFMYLVLLVIWIERLGLLHFVWNSVEKEGLWSLGSFLIL